jgi:hypothetical protein
MGGTEEGGNGGEEGCREGYVALSFEIGILYPYYNKVA